jgi:polycystin 2
MANPITFYYNNLISDIFSASGTSDPVPVTFQDIGSSDDWWNVIQNPFLDSLYESNSTDGNNFIYSENKLLGVPRLRQLRVQKNSCKVASIFEYTIPECYAAYNLLNEDKDPYGLFIENDTSDDLTKKA